MHVSRKPPAVAASLPPAIPTLLRVAFALVATATLLFLFTPTIVRGQELTGMHQVEPGESLWSLAVRYYGDGQKWQDLAKLNDLGSTGEKGLVVGQTIKTPKSAPAPVKTSAISPPPNTSRFALARARQPLRTEAMTADAPSASGGLAAQTAGKGDAAGKPAAIASRGGVGRAAPTTTTRAPAKAVQRANTSANAATAAAADAHSATNIESSAFAHASTTIWNPDLASQRAARGVEQTTVFLGRTYDPVETESAVRSVIKVEKPRARTGEFGSAPYAVDAGQAGRGGMVGHRSGSAASLRDVERLILTDEVEITVPPAFVPTVGAQLISIQTAPLTRGDAVVATPTGVLEIVKAEPGRPVIARVVRQSGRIEEGQALLPFPGAAVSNALTTTPVARSASGPETHVIWIEGDALLPTLQSFLVLAAGEREGIRPGDEFALVQRAGVGADAREQAYAVVRVVRVTSLGSTAIVIRQSDALIAVGGAARLIAKAN
jgi:LysM repeat protein